MRVTREQAATNRERVLDAAGTMFRTHGFDGVGVADIMKRAGLTHGGFYGHFASKDDLAAEACERILTRGDWLERVTGTADPSLGEFAHAYLSPQHRDHPGRGCLMAAVGSDVARQPRSLRRVFTDGLRARVETLTAMVSGRSRAARREQALATIAGLVGALVLSRAVSDPELSDEILEAAAATFSQP
ncbi:MAG: TetR/AcrR family transcriptional regulator [Acidobacteriota bacterium]